MGSRFYWFIHNLNFNENTFDLSVVVNSSVSMLLFDVLKYLKFSRKAEFHSNIIKVLMEALSNVSTRKVVSLDGVRESVSFVDGYCAGDSIS